MSTKIEATMQNILDATNFREPEKIPVGADIEGWSLNYAGVTFEDVVDDPSAFANAYCQLFNQLPLDFVLTGGFPGVAFQSFHELGNKAYNLSDDKTAINHNQADSKYMGPEAYDEVINDVNHFLDETLLKSKYPAFQLPKDEAYNALKNSALKYKNFYDTSMLIANYFAQNDTLVFCDTPYSYYAPYNYFFDFIRGIKDALTDIRRMPEKVEAACDAIWERDKYNLQMDPQEAENPFPFIMSVYHAECFLSPKLFDRLVWKYFVEAAGPLMEAGKKFFLFGEGNLMHIYDRFRELPKGSAIIMCDTDNAFEVYDKIGDWATIMTGADTTLMASGSKQQCIDHVKKCFDTFAPGGGFIFHTNREIVGAKDAKPENLFAVYETANELSLGKG